jgi:hypothetical protein
MPVSNIFLVFDADITMFDDGQREVRGFFMAMQQPRSKRVETAKFINIQKCWEFNYVDHSAFEDNLKCCLEQICQTIIHESIHETLFLLDVPDLLDFIENELKESIS